MVFAYQRRSRYTVTVPTKGLLAAGMVLMAMWSFYWSSNGLAAMGDWTNHAYPLDAHRYLL